jgi:hypothetical protein
MTTLEPLMRYRLVILNKGEFTGDEDNQFTLKVTMSEKSLFKKPDGSQQKALPTSINEI